MAATRPLHQSHADEKRFREDAVTRLQEEQGKIQNRLDRLYDDRLDGFIEPDFFERKSPRVATNTIWKDHALTATFRQPFDLLELRTQLGKEKRPPELIPATFILFGSPTLDNLRNFLLTRTTEVLSFFQQLREAP